MSDRPVYDEMRVQSAVLADVARGPSDGTNLNTLRDALPCTSAEVESAIERLRALGVVHLRAGRVALGAEPGSPELVGVMRGRSAPAVPESLAIALGSQRRLRILVAMLKGPASATSLGRGAIPDLTVDDIDYHLKKLKSAGAIHLLSSQKVRGATKHTYVISEPWKSLVVILATFDPRAPARESGCPVGAD